MGRRDIGMMVFARRCLLMAGLIALMMAAACTNLSGEPEVIATITPAAIEETPSATLPPTAGRITGQVTNGTDGGEVPAELPVSLLIFDAEGVAVDSMTTTVDGENRFAFEDVEIATGYLYFAVAIYRDRNFSSQEAIGDPAAPEIELNVSIYELTEDALALSIAEITMQVNAFGENLEILQSVRIRNASDRMFVSTVPVDAEANVFATVALTLPVGAAVVGFDNERRYINLAEETSVIDTLPVLPGEDHRLILTYVVPYTDGAVIDFPVLYPLQGPVRVLVGTDSLTVRGEGFSAAGTETVSGDVYEVYSAALDLQARESVIFEVIGPAPVLTSDDRTVVTSDRLTPILAIATLMIGLLVGGLVLTRQRGAGVGRAQEALIDGLTRQISELDDQHSAGQINHDVYQQRRAQLKARLAAAMGQHPPPSEEER